MMSLIFIWSLSESYETPLDASDASTSSGWTDWYSRCGWWVHKDVSTCDSITLTQPPHPRALLIAGRTTGLTRGDGRPGQPSDSRSAENLTGVTQSEGRGLWSEGRGCSVALCQYRHLLPTRMTLHSCGGDSGGGGWQSWLQWWWWWRSWWWLVVMVKAVVMPLSVVMPDLTLTHEFLTFSSPYSPTSVSPLHNRWSTTNHWNI